MGGYKEYDRQSSLLRGLTPAGLSVALLAVVGVLGFMILEGLSLIDAIYATTGVITTVGIVVIPKTAAGRAFTAVFNVISLGCGMLLVSEIGDGRKAWARHLLKGGSKAATAYTEMLYLFVAAAVPYVAAVLAFCVLEGWTLPASAYFSLTCASGLGMADTEPLQPLSRLIFCLYLWFVMGAAINLLGMLGSLIISLVMRLNPAMHGGSSSSGSGSGTQTEAAQ